MAAEQKKREPETLRQGCEAELGETILASNKVRLSAIARVEHTSVG